MGINHQEPFLDTKRNSPLSTPSHNYSRSSTRLGSVDRLRVGLEPWLEVNLSTFQLPRTVADGVDTNATLHSDPHRLQTSWIYLLILFLAGANTFTFVVLARLVVVKTPWLQRTPAAGFVHAILSMVVAALTVLACHRHSRSREDGYICFYRRTNLLKKAPFYVFAIGNSLLLVLSYFFHTPEDIPRSLQLDKMALVVITDCILVFEFLTLIPIVILYVKLIRLFFHERPAPETALRLAKRSTSLGNTFFGTRLLDGNGDVADYDNGEDDRENIGFRISTQSIDSWIDYSSPTKSSFAGLQKLRREDLLSLIGVLQQRERDMAERLLVVQEQAKKISMKEGKKYENQDNTVEKVNKEKSSGESNIKVSRYMERRRDELAARLTRAERELDAERRLTKRLGGELQQIKKELSLEQAVSEDLRKQISEILELETDDDSGKDAEREAMKLLEKIHKYEVE
eukprot:g6247.t1